MLYPGRFILIESVDRYTGCQPFSILVWREGETGSQCFEQARQPEYEVTAGTNTGSSCYINSQKHESTLLHMYVLNEYLTADRSITTKYF